jgi:hypothetical protein
MGKFDKALYGLAYLTECLKQALTSEKAIKVYKGAAIALGGIVLEAIISALPGMDIPPQYSTLVAGGLAVALNALRKIVI